MESKDLGVVVRGCVGFHKEKAKIRSIQLEVEINGTLPPVRINQAAIGRALDELLENAIRFSKEGGMVKVRCKNQGNEVDIHISDAGEGIPQEDMGKLFEAFPTVDSHAEEDGRSTGLGLLIVRRIMELHGGRVRAESSRGKGSTFSFTLPVCGQALLG
jgi:signal transduction histidine kinase